MSSGFPQNDALRLEPGLKLDRYELLCVLAHGGMGSVWLARLAGKHGFEKVVALKTVLPQHAPDEKYRNMFLDEARLASRIAHPNVAQTIDLGETSGILYFVMEWVDGDSLRKLRLALEKKQEPFPTNLALRIVSDACGALHAAHELVGEDGAPLNVVHRDISPQNILLSVLGITKVIDFGIAKARERLAEATNTDEMRGKVDYIAPEQAMGIAIDRRADVWSLGAVLYYLIAGAPPFEGDTQIASLLARIEGKKPPPLAASVPSAVRAVVDKALARQPADRYANAADMQRAIEQAASSAGPAVTAADVARFMKLHLGEGIERRKKAVQAALDEAASRSKKNLRFESPLEGSSSSRQNVDTPSPQIAASLDGAPISSSSAEAIVEAKEPAKEVSLEPDLVPQGVPRDRRLRVVVGAICALAVGIGVLGLVLRANDGKAAGSPTALAQTPALPALPALPARSAAIVPPRDESVAPDASIALAVASAAPVPPPPGRGSSLPARPAPRPAPAATKTKGRVVDDGF